MHHLVQLYLHHAVHDMHALLREQRISMPQMGALHLLHVEGPRSIGAVAEHLGLSLAATSHLVDRLVQRDLVTRSEDPEDRRQKRVDLAPDGVALIERSHLRSIEGFDRQLDRLPNELRRRLERDAEEAVALLAPDAVGCA